MPRGSAKFSTMPTLSVETNVRESPAVSVDNRASEPMEGMNPAGSLNEGLGVLPDTTDVSRMNKEFAELDRQFGLAAPLECKELSDDMTVEKGFNISRRVKQSQTARERKVNTMAKPVSPKLSVGQPKRPEPIKLRTPKVTKPKPPTGKTMKGAEAPVMKGFLSDFEEKGASSSAMADQGPSGDKSLGGSAMNAIGKLGRVLKRDKMKKAQQDELRKFIRRQQAGPQAYTLRGKEDGIVAKELSDDMVVEKGKLGGVFSRAGEIIVPNTLVGAASGSAFYGVNKLAQMFDKDKKKRRKKLLLELPEGVDVQKEPKEVDEDMYVRKGFKKVWKFGGKNTGRASMVDSSRNNLQQTSGEGGSSDGTPRNKKRRS